MPVGLNGRENFARMGTLILIFAVLDEIDEELCCGSGSAPWEWRALQVAILKRSDPAKHQNTAMELEPPFERSSA